jgi:putative zinc finger/helix-turn-helix YgiT family protein
MRNGEKAHDVLVDIIRMECPLCGKTHDIELRKREAMIIIKSEQVSYDESYFLCHNQDDGENTFENNALNKSNLLNARNAYRILKGLLTSDEIIDIREQYGLSQADLSDLLGWGKVTISRYESKAIQDEAYDNALRTIKEDPLKTYAYLKKNKQRFSDIKYAAIIEKINLALTDHGREYLSRQMLEQNYISFSEPSDYNGNRTLSIDKIESIISYYAKCIDHLYKVKLMKMLWYADALSYKKTGIAMTGLVYRHNDMGALPIGHNEITGLENVNVQKEENYDSVAYRFLPNESLDLSVIDPEEQNILDMVIEKFKYFNAREIVEYMHAESAYIKTEASEVILFSLACEIRDFSTTN